MEEKTPNNAHINWFPGHMSKTLKEMQKDSRLCDGFIYILDARCPNSCLNPEFVKVVKGKPIIYVLNKADLVTEQDLQAFTRYFKAKSGSCISLNATKSGTSKVIISELNRVFARVLQENKQKGVTFIKRLMILGVPNSGKSSIVNNLANKGKAVTGNKAGVTKSKQWVNLNNNFCIMDTPGVLLPKIKDEDTAFNLAIVGSIKDEVLNIVEVALSLLKKLDNIDPSLIISKYGVVNEYNTEYVEKLNQIALKRGCVKKGGVPDTERAAKMLLTDFRAGKLGRICLEKL